MSELNDEKTLNLLRIAAADLPSPDADLLAWMRLTRGDSVETVLSRIAEPLGVSAAQLLAGDATLDDLRRVKSRCVLMARDNLNARDRLAALLTYRLVIAAALIHHGVLISSRSRTEWDGRWIDLSVDAPEPWRTFLRRAADSE